MTDSLVENFNRLVGQGPSMLERDAGMDRAMLAALSKAFSTKVKPGDVKYILYRKYRDGVELEDTQDRLGNILTSVERREADPAQLVAFLKKHGAKTLKSEARRVLKMGPADVDSKATQSLRGMKLKARNRGDLQSAIVSAGYYAKKHEATMYVYGGTSYGHGVWRVSMKKSEYLDPINNTQSKMLSVAPDLQVAWHQVER
jgi:hypothetical protein